MKIRELKFRTLLIELTEDEASQFMREADSASGTHLVITSIRAGLYGAEVRP
jgi:hypothetical protein